MVRIVTMFKVAGYERWRRVCDPFFRNAGEEGATRVWIYRAVDDGDEVMMMVEAPTREQAEHIMRRPEDLRTLLEAAGMDIYPAMFVGEVAEEISYD